MKKRFRLFSTILSLCFALCVLTFGVYAASTVTYTVSGNVSYTMDDVLVTVTTYTSYVADAHGAQSSTTVPSLNYGSGNGTMVGEAYTSYTNNVANVADGTDTQSVENVDINFSTSTAWRVRITVHTINPDGVEVALDSAADFGVSDSANYDIIGASSNSYGTQITNGSTATFDYYIFLKDPTVAVASTAYSIQLSITQYVA